MATHSVTFIEPTGGTFYAFPTSQSLASWTTYRVQLAEGSAPNTGRYTGTLNDANGLSWAVFSGASQPSSWDERIATLTLTAESINSKIGTPSGASLSDDVDAITTSVTSLTGGIQSRQNYEPDIKVYLSDKRELEASPRVRLRAGTVPSLRVGIDCAPRYGRRNQVASVGTPVVASGSSITCTAAGPRDEPESGHQWAVVTLGGSASAGEEVTVDVPITFASGATVTERFIVDVAYAAPDS